MKHIHYNIVYEAYQPKNKKPNTNSYLSKKKRKFDESVYRFSLLLLPRVNQCCSRLACDVTISCSPGLYRWLQCDRNCRIALKDLLLPTLLKKIYQFCSNIYFVSIDGCADDKRALPAIKTH